MAEVYADKNALGKDGSGLDAEAQQSLQMAAKNILSYEFLFHLGTIARLFGYPMFCSGDWPEPDRPVTDSALETLKRNLSDHLVVAEMQESFNILTTVVDSMIVAFDGCICHSEIIAHLPDAALQRLYYFLSLAHPLEIIVIPGNCSNACFSYILAAHAMHKGTEAAKIHMRSMRRLAQQERSMNA